MKTFIAVFAIVTMISGAAFADCPGDLNGDGTVGFADLTQVLGGWGDCTDCDADLNGDGTVGFADLTQVLGGWGDCPNPCVDLAGVDFMAGGGAPMPLGAGVIDGSCTMIFGTGIPAGITLYANVAECSAVCDGCVDNTECPADEYCNFAEFTCGDDGSLGVCEARAEVCAQIYDPVCTCDYTISSSLCHASITGDPVMFLGECAQEDVCTHSGGTWDGTDCTCPAGQDYGYQRGCQVL